MTDSPAGLCEMYGIPFFPFTFLVIKFISQEETSCCCMWLLGR